MKKFKVVTNRPRVVHRLAFCHICDLQWDLFNNYKKGTKLVHDHVMKTGHRVDIESGTTSECTREITP